MTPGKDEVDLRCKVLDRYDGYVFLCDREKLLAEISELKKKLKECQNEAKELLDGFAAGGYVESGDGPLLDRLHP